MVISRTPFRLSFLGGLTDLPSFFADEEGATLTCTIKKYMYITVNERFDETYRIAYSKTEIVDQPAQIDHKIVRTILNTYGPAAREKDMGRGLEIMSMADIPAGTGLGSSSAFTVGLLLAMKAHLGTVPSPAALAAEAARIEIEECREPIGKQDQYAAAFGGLRFFRYLPSGEVIGEPIGGTDETKRALEASLMLFYTGITRSASAVIKEHKADPGWKRETLREMKKLADRGRRVIEGNRPLAEFGDLLHEGWLLKKSMASGISAPRIDDWYERARGAGAWGGKILGAGGGGFLMLVADPERQPAIRQALADLRYVPIAFENFGSRIIFVG
ncbi:MAG: hypothetical protein NDI61_07005 [Bdellovibrionaceae bacterium]|nr:hypothetical protein [Pseudobdellovibrionaceae bacterium]